MKFVIIMTMMMREGDQAKYLDAVCTFGWVLKGGSEFLDLMSPKLIEIREILNVKTICLAPICQTTNRLDMFSLCYKVTACL